MLFKQPDEYATRNPVMRYRLCGMATDSRTTFVLRRAKETLVNMDEGEPEKDQWWKLHYSNDPEITKTRVEEDAVAKAGEESRDVLLVYGSDAAIADRGGSSLPDPLEVQHSPFLAGYSLGMPARICC